MHTKVLAICGISLALAGCSAMNPQEAAKQQAEAYYGRPYEQLNTREKMRLGNHLARQSNQSWRTTAHAASGFGRFLQGVGFLLIGAKH